MKTLESTKDGKKVSVLCIVDRNHERSVVLLDHFRNFKGIYSIVVATSKMEEHLSRERKLLYCLKLKKKEGSQKLKSCLK